MPVFKNPGEPEKPDPLFEYLERTSLPGKKQQRIDALLKQLNLQTALMLESIEHPPKDSKKN